MALVIILTSEKKNVFFTKDHIAKILGKLFLLYSFNFEKRCRCRWDKETEATAGRENTLKHELVHQQN